jgi:hypothetical protein
LPVLGCAWGLRLCSAKYFLKKNNDNVKKRTVAQDRQIH